MKDAEMRSRIIGVSSTMKSFNFYFGTVLGELILRHCDNLSRTLQGPHVSAAEGQQIATMTVKTLRLIRSEESLSCFGENLFQKLMSVTSVIQNYLAEGKLQSAFS